MAHKNYAKGRKKEYKFVNAARALGFISGRTAGSHGIFDVYVIDTTLKRIKFLQCKPNNYTGSEKLVEKYIDLNGTFDVTFEVV